MSADPAHVVCHALHKRFEEGPPVLEGITFSAAPRDFISLLGPSGCGKSTLLRLIAGLTPPTAGRIEIASRGPAKHREDLAFVFQESALLPWLTVAANVELPLQLRGMPAPRRHEIRDRVLAQVSLTEKANAYPRQLSGGQKMRVSLARALTVSPRLLLLDEPFGALDEMTRHHLNEELLALREREAWTAFFVTHSVAEAVFLSNRILVMAARPGRIHAEISVPLPFPRTAATRESAAYQQLVAEATATLRSAEDASSR
jgi:ABC-type nitrate/sulfonate/bicarbonate transport system, ATPase component